MYVFYPFTRGGWRPWRAWLLTISIPFPFVITSWNPFVVVTIIKKKKKNHIIKIFEIKWAPYLIPCHFMFLL